MFCPTFQVLCRSNLNEVHIPFKKILFTELVIGDQVAGIAGLKTQLQVPGTTTTTSTADVSNGAAAAGNGNGTGNGDEEMDEMKSGEEEATPASPLNCAKGDKVKVKLNKIPFQDLGLVLLA